MASQPTLLDMDSDMETASGTEFEAVEGTTQRRPGVPRAAAVAVSLLGLLALLLGTVMFASHSGPAEAKATDTVQLSFSNWFTSASAGQGNQNSASTVASNGLAGASGTASSFLSNMLGGNKNAAGGGSGSASSFLSNLLGGGSSGSAAQGNRNAAAPADSPPSQGAVIDWVKSALTKADANTPVMQGAPSQGSNLNANFLNALGSAGPNMQQSALSLLGALGQKDNGRNGAPAMPGLNSLMAQAHSAGLDLGQFVPSSAGASPGGATAGGATAGSKPSGGFFSNMLGGVLGGR